MAVIGGTLVYVVGRRWVSIPQDFSYIETLTGGGLAGASAILLDGEAGSGRSEVAEALLHRAIKSGLRALVVLYDLHEAEYLRRADQYGHEFTSAENTGSLRILDCQSPLVGSPQSELVRDPYNLTYVSIAINDELDKFQDQRYILLLESAIPLFNRLNASRVIDFIQMLSVRVKRDNSMFLLSIASQSMAPEVTNRLAATADGVIDTKLERIFGRRRKTLSVRWIKERKIPDVKVRFDVVRDKGVVFRISPR